MKKILIKFDSKAEYLLIADYLNSLGFKNHRGIDNITYYDNEGGGISWDSIVLEKYDWSLASFENSIRFCREYSCYDISNVKEIESLYIAK